MHRHFQLLSLQSVLPWTRPSTSFLRSMSFQVLHLAESLQDIVMLLLTRPLWGPGVLPRHKHKHRKHSKCLQQLMTSQKSRILTLMIRHILMRNLNSNMIPHQSQTNGSHASMMLPSYALPKVNQSFHPRQEQVTNSRRIRGLPGPLPSSPLSHD